MIFRLRRFLCALCAASLIVAPGCWNYTEIDDMTIVAGVAVDRDPKSGKLMLTAELVNTKGSLEQSQNNAYLVSLAGNTMFEIVRGMIAMTGKKLFWSHAKTIILSEEVAREGIVNVMDWFSRDTETRADVYVFVSREKTAHEVLEFKENVNSLVSFDLYEVMRDEKHVSNAPVIEIWDFIDRMESPGKAAIAPDVSLRSSPGTKRQYHQVNGTAVFTFDKLVGHLTGEESKAMMFIKNEIIGGVLAVMDEKGDPAFSLEIYDNRTKLNPIIDSEGDLRLNISTVTKVGLDEVRTSDGLLSPESSEKIEQLAENQLEKEIKDVIHKTQSQFKVDIFGFGEYLHENEPQYWRKNKENWDRLFSTIEVSVDSDITIISTAKTMRSIKRRK